MRRSLQNASTRATAAVSAGADDRERVAAVQRPLVAQHRRGPFGVRNYRGIIDERAQFALCGGEVVHAVIIARQACAMTHNPPMNADLGPRNYGLGSL